MKASQDTGACYGVMKCAEIVFNRGRIVKTEGLNVLAERMKAQNPGQSKIISFLNVEQDEQIDTDAVYKRAKAEMDKRMKSLTSTELCERNLIKTITQR